MNKFAAALAFASLLGVLPTSSNAQRPGFAKPQLLLREVVQGMPRGSAQEVRVLTATFQPGDRTVFHTHRPPVTVYVLESDRMTGYNRSSKEPLRVVIFYVSDPGTPFLDEVRPAGAAQ
jgi:hypothetical protein